MQNLLKENYINYLETNKSLFFRVDIHLIWGCNFKCIMCDNWKKEIELNFTYNDIQKFILILKKDYNCNYIRFHWQEPTMYNNLEDLILFSKKIWLKLGIKTNAWLLSDKRLIKIIKYWLDELYLSIDWPNEEIHDYIRWKKWSFKKNVDIIVKSKKINPNLKIFINSVIMKDNFKYLSEMLDFWNKYKLDRVSFVFLNDKNRKDIEKINLNKKEFTNFFENTILDIYTKSNLYNIWVDFSPFLSSISWLNNNLIIPEIKNNIQKYKIEINEFFKWNYWKYFFDKYGCFWPIDHCSINYNWDMFSCCVVERDSSNSVWNILQNNLKKLWNSQKYINSRNNSNEKCLHSKKCASNFFSRKNLFKSIYLDDNLYTKNNPRNYYRYYKEIYYENFEILNNIKLKKFKNILLKFYDNLEFYRLLVEKNNIFREDILKFDNLDFIKKLPILDKKILKQNILEIKKLSIWNKVLNWKTSWNSWEKLDFFYPLDFKRYIKQIAIFSQEWDFVYEDKYFALIPINCNQTIINNLIEPDYVKKIYITISNFEYKKEIFLLIKKIFEDNKNVKFLHWDSKFILFVILWFKKYNLALPKLNWISISYSYTNKSLKKYIEKNLKCSVYDNYWCSEIWPIALDNNWNKEIYWDNSIIYDTNWDLIISDLDNDIFPFLNYRNWDKWKVVWNIIELYWKENQIINWKNLKQLDDFFYNNFPEIIFYQFNENNLSIVWENIDIKKIENKVYNFLWIKFDIVNLENDFFTIWECSKFKIINK